MEIHYYIFKNFIFQLLFLISENNKETQNGFTKEMK